MDTARLTVPGKAARPHIVRAVAAGIVAIAGMVTASFGQLFGEGRGPDRDDATAAEVTLAVVGALVLLVAGIAATRYVATAVRRAMEEHVGDTRGAPLGTVVTAIGYVIVVLSALAVLEVELQGLLLGGALTGVVVGIAAQQTLGNFFAGMVLLMVRPFTLGDRVILKSGPLGGEYEGTITDMSLFYVRMETSHGPVALPNAGVLASAVGPGARSAEPDPAMDEGESG